MLSDILINQNWGMEGEYHLRAISETTGEVREFGPFKNIITNIGLNRLGTDSAGIYFYVGTGSGTPAATDTSMFTFLAQTSTLQAQSSGTPAGSPDYWSVCSTTKRFAAGVAAGNLTEVGVGWNTSPVNAIFSHALIVDGSGNPTTITILSDEVLDVTYTFRLYPPLTDVTGSITISGTSYAYTLRSAGLPQAGGALALFNSGFTSAAGMLVYTGTIGAITSTPSGTNVNIGNGVMSAYSNNSLERAATWTAGLAQGNVAGGIKSISSFWSTSQIAGFQCEFTPVIPKDNTKVLTLAFKVAWARRTI